MWFFTKKIDETYLNLQNFKKVTKDNFTINYLNEHDLYTFIEKITALKINKESDLSKGTVYDKLLAISTTVFRIIFKTHRKTYSIENNINIYIFDHHKTLQKFYYLDNNKEVDYIAFYNLKNKTLYLSLNNINENIIIHEFAHIILNEFVDFNKPLHEVIAQYCEAYYHRYM